MNRIKELRTQKGIKQSELAKVLAVAPPTLSGYETGKTQAPIELYIKCAEYFGVSLDYLFGGNEYIEPVQLPAPFPELSDRFARLDEMDRVRVLAYMDGILAGEKYSSPLNKRAAG